MIRKTSLSYNQLYDLNIKLFKENDKLEKCIVTI